MGEMTRADFDMFENIQKCTQWMVACMRLRDRHNGSFPDDWWQQMKESGRMQEIVSRFVPIPISQDIRSSSILTVQAIERPRKETILHGAKFRTSSR
jgi:hypothetical protein